MKFAQLVVVISTALTVSARIPSLLATTLNVTTCQPGFEWTNNEQNASPCQLAASVYVSCAGSNWNIGPLEPGHSYNIPGMGVMPVNQCSCSWAAYNLISACTLCQNQESAILNWPTYSTNCSGQTSNEYFPSSQHLLDGTGIPAYAVTNPTQWGNQKFDKEEAKAIADKGEPDSFPGQPSKKQSSSHVGPIVGGVIGGLAVIVMAGGLAFCMYRRKRRGKHSQSSVPLVDKDRSYHARTMSDLSQKSGIGYGYQQLDRSFATSPTSQPPVSPTSGTMHTHSTSVNSLSFFGSVRHSVMPYGTSASPPPAAAQTILPGVAQSPPPNGLNPQDIIVPFTLPPSDPASHQSSNANLADRKRPDGAIIPVYDHPNSLPTHIAPPDTPRSSTPRTRINPPSYDDVEGTSVAPSRAQQAHSKKGSGDTQFSIDSKTSGPAPVVQRHGAGTASMSGMDEVIGQMGFGPQESVSAGGTLSTGQSQMAGVRPFRPVLGNPDP